MNLDPRRLVGGPWGRFGGSSAADVSLILTLLLLIFHFHSPNEPWYLRTPLLILAVAGFIWPHLRRDPRFWFVISTVLWSVYTERWWLLDNHEFLIGYWCVAIFAVLALRPADLERLLAANATLLIGLSMLLAVVWKLASSSYVDGSMFEFLLMTDARFSNAASWVARIPDAAIIGNHQLVADLVHHVGAADGVSGPPAPVQLTGSRASHPIALFLTWWTVAIESTLAVLFLWPHAPRTVRLAQHGVLLLFLVTTNSVATVVSFAWILIVMAIARTEPDEVGARFAYAFGLLVVLAYQTPVGGIARNL